MIRTLLAWAYVLTLVALAVGVWIVLFYCLLLFARGA
jgi:hypothetical protein